MMGKSQSHFPASIYFSGGLSKMTISPPFHDGLMSCARRMLHESA